jgi:hypothetical protein
MAITINGTGSITGLTAGGLPDGSIVAGDLASSLDLTGKTVTLPSGTGGKVLQVVQASKTNTTSTINQDSFTDLGLSASITPTSTSNKVLVLVSIGRVCCNTSSLRLCPFRILRDATGIGIGVVDGVKLRSNFVISDSPDNNYGQGGAYQYLDSPSTTSATTYKIQWTGQAGETWYLHRSSSNTDNTDTIHTRSASHIILMEVAG